MLIYFRSNSLNGICLKYNIHVHDEVGVLELFVILECSPSEVDMIEGMLVYANNYDC